MTNALHYETRPEDNEPALDLADGSPTSGVHDLHARYDLDEDLYLPDSKSDDLEQIEEAAPASWLEGLMTKLKTRISSAPPKVEVKEFVPSEEQILIDKIAMEEASLELFRTIVTNRKRIYEDALTLGMTHDEITESGDYCLSPVITDGWKNRTREKIRIISDLKITLDTKRTERLARG